MLGAGLGLGQPWTGGSPDMELVLGTHRPPGRGVWNSPAPWGPSRGEGNPRAEAGQGVRGGLGSSQQRPPCQVWGREGARWEGPSGERQHSCALDAYCVPGARLVPLGAIYSNVRSLSPRAPQKFRGDTQRATTRSVLPPPEAADCWEEFVHVEGHRLL